MSEPAPKKAKPAYTFNVNKALDKEFETKPLREVVQLPPSALQGLADRANEMLAAFHVKTIADLAQWKHARIAQAICTLAAVEEEGKRDPSGESNINKALDKDYETKSLKEISEAPVHCLQGLADWTDSTLSKLNVKTVSDLANWKFVRWSQALVELAKFESPDHSS
ncbi:hypothetical protein PTSG_09571 [Salpingoeca rosetta]|uniref:Uncharacterized protein n=1 Tax=Salpingoeca rosetta (strain ATCC 50818 / BSB-021) TaxID=946362 RepID=F2ULD7_SALR5|nr:uncharacterized protein PTSG_09571 [Salpingoeca rosetta]EGD77936.1 hypothetical protein PTSG_09571 [Salpingoeca rosetta]|eukprot:XP_004989999.1 hypothetical protein PTSG_09571 [Salpingoeca rosetta]